MPKTVRHGNFRVPNEAILAATLIPEGRYDRVLLAAALLRAGWSPPATPRSQASSDD